MFKITRCLLAKGVLDSDELILRKVKLLDFLAFTQRFAQKPAAYMTGCSSDSGSDNSDSQVVCFGFPDKSVKKNKIKDRHYYKEEKKWLRLCKKLKEHGVVIPLTLMKNPIAKACFK